jgi:hypothetical protein
MNIVKRERSRGKFAGGKVFRKNRFGEEHRCSCKRGFKKGSSICGLMEQYVTLASKKHTGNLRTVSYVIKRDE